MTIQATLSFILRKREVLLLRKAKGLFGQGKWNVPGGKIADGEDPQHCAIRETLEETGLRVSNPQQLGRVHFYKDTRRDLPEWIGYVFVSDKFTGTLTESREGILKWFNMDQLPYSEMWEDDPLWTGLVFSHKRFEGWFYYTGDFEKLVDHKIVQL